MLCLSQEPEVGDAQKVAARFVGRRSLFPCSPHLAHVRLCDCRCFVDWPFLKEALVAAASDGQTKWTWAEGKVTAQKLNTAAQEQ